MTAPNNVDETIPPETPSTDERWSAWLVDAAIAAGVSAALLAGMGMLSGHASRLARLAVEWAKRRRVDGGAVDRVAVRKKLLTDGNPQFPRDLRLNVGYVLREQAYPQGWIAGRQSARAALPYAGARMPRGITLDVDWQGWEPGDWQAARKLVDAQGDASGFRELLDEAGVQISKIADNRLDEVARCLADGLEKGATPQQLARDLTATLEDRGWAMTVAWTETSRAIAAAAEDTYRQAGVRTRGWMTALDQRVCPACMADEAAGFVDIDRPFPSGTLRPPGHPRCRCALIPGPIAEEDVFMAVVPDLVKDFDPDQPRDDHGRWSKISAAIGAISEAMGEAVRMHSIFGAPEGGSDSHGLVTMHDTIHGRVYALNLHDSEVGTTWVATLTGEDSAELEEGLYEAVEKARVGESGSIANDVNEDDEDSVEFWQIDYDPVGLSLRINVGEEETETEVLLSVDDADSLVEALHEMRNSDPDNRLSTVPLPDGHAMGRRMVFDGGERDVVLGVVSIPGGDRLRLGLAGIEDAPTKRWTGGQGQMVADLGHHEARILVTDLDEIIAEMQDYERKLKLADELEDEWYDSAAGQRMGTLLDEGWSLWSQGDGQGGIETVVKRSSGPRGARTEELAPPDIETEYRVLAAELQKIRDDLGLVDEGETIGYREVDTPWGTVTLETLGNLLEYDDPVELRLSVRPRGVSVDDWNVDTDRADFGITKVKKLRKSINDFVTSSDLLKMAVGQPRDDHGRWARWQGISEQTIEALEDLYGPLLEADSFHVGGDGEGNFTGWVSLHEDGTLAITHEAATPDGSPQMVLDTHDVQPIYWTALVDQLREAADALDEGDESFYDHEGPSDDPYFSLSLDGDDEHPVLDFDAGASGWSFDDPEDAREFADRIEAGLQQLDAWEEGDYDDEPDDDEELTKDAKPGHRGSSWAQQWKHGKLRKKWVGKAHPWTALFRHLRKHMPLGMAKRTASQWFHDVFGIWSGERKGDNPVGPG